MNDDEFERMAALIKREVSGVEARIVEKIDSVKKELDEVRKEGRERGANQADALSRVASEQDRHARKLTDHEQSLRKHSGFVRTASDPEMGHAAAVAAAKIAAEAAEKRAEAAEKRAAAAETNSAEATKTAKEVKAALVVREPPPSHVRNGAPVTVGEETHKQTSMIAAAAKNTKVQILVALITLLTIAGEVALKLLERPANAQQTSTQTRPQ
jgi:septal ring factor EnvC (AmiA/AmiB activator)